MNYNLSDLQNTYFENFELSNSNLISSLKLLDQNLKYKNLDDDDYTEVKDLITKLLNTNYYLSSIQNSYNDIYLNINNILKK